MSSAGRHQETLLFTTVTFTIHKALRLTLPKSDIWALFCAVMPTTRSSTRIAANSIQRVNVTTESSDAKGDAPKSTSRATTKKRIAEDASDTPRNQKKSRKAAVEVAISMKVDEPLGSPGEEDTDAVVPAVLTFSLDEAKQHLISVDHRFEDLFNKLACKPYENLERFHPFQCVFVYI